jgi:hypothetical protein
MGFLLPWMHSARLERTLQQAPACAQAARMARGARACIRRLPVPCAAPLVMRAPPDLPVARRPYACPARTARPVQGPARTVRLVVGATRVRGRPLASTSALLDTTVRWAPPAQLCVHAQLESTADQAPAPASIVLPGSGAIGRLAHFHATPPALQGMLAPLDPAPKDSFVRLDRSAMPARTLAHRAFPLNPVVVLCGLAGGREGRNYCVVFLSFLP